MEGASDCSKNNREPLETGTADRSPAAFAFILKEFPSDIWSREASLARLKLDLGENGSDVQPDSPFEPTPPISPDPPFDPAASLGFVVGFASGAAASYPAREPHAPLLAAALLLANRWTGGNYDNSLDHQRFAPKFCK